MKIKRNANTYRRKKNTKHHEYLIAYSFRNGNGTYKIDLAKEIKTLNILKLTNECLQNLNPQLIDLNITNYQLIRKW